MMMLKAFSAITLAALPVRSAKVVAQKHWTLNKNGGGFFTKTSMTCPIGDIHEDDNKKLRDYIKKHHNLQSVGWTIKLPKSTVFKNMVDKVGDHQVRFVCVDRKTLEVHYLTPKGNPRKGPVKFTPDEIKDMKIQKLSEFPDKMAAMGYTNGNNVLSRYRGANGNFFFLFNDMTDALRFNTVLDNVIYAYYMKKGKKWTGFKKITDEEKVDSDEKLEESDSDDIYNMSVDDAVAKLHDLLVQANKAMEDDEEAQQYLEINLGIADSRRTRFFMSALSAMHNGVAPLAYLDQTSTPEKYVMADGVNSGNIESLIDGRFRPKLREKLKKFLGLPQRRRLATMQRLVIETEKTFSS